MEKFIITIQSLYDDINLQKTTPSILINNIIIQKQYIVYYVYRIICSNFEYFRSLSLGRQIKQINNKLDIDVKYKFICYPLANRMTNDEQKLDDIFTEMTTILNNAIAKIKSLHKPNDDLELFLDKKNYGEIVKDIKELISFVPNLSKYRYYT